MAKPISVPTWASDEAAKVTEPSAGRKAIGLNPGDRLPAQVFNWLFREACAWFEWASTYGADVGLANTFSAINTFTAALKPHGAAGDANAAIDCTGAAITTRKLILALPGTRKVRFYVTSAGELEVTVNAVWGGSTWSPDSSGMELRLRVKQTGLEMEYNTSVGEFNEGTWTPIWKALTDGRWKVLNATTGSGGSNPPSTTALTNDLRAKLFCKAWAKVTNTSGTIALVDGANIASVAADGTGFARITLASKLKKTGSDDHGVVVVMPSTSYTAYGAFLADADNTLIRIGRPVVGGSMVDMSGYSETFMVLVFGTQD